MTTRTPGSSGASGTSATAERRAARRACLPARGDRPEAGKRPSLRRSARPALRRLPLERRRDRRPARPSGFRGRRRHGSRGGAGDAARRSAPTPTWESCCCWPPWRPFPRESILPKESRGSLPERPSRTRALSIARSGLHSQAEWAKCPTRTSAAEPTIPLRAVMALAAGRDTIALQYANGFREVLCEGLPALRRAAAGGPALETAIIAAYLRLLARYPDSLIRPEARPEPGERGFSSGCRRARGRLARAGRGAAALRRI